MKIFARVEWKLACSFIGLVVVGLVGWRFGLWTMVMNGAFKNSKTIGNIYGIVVGCLSIIYLIAKRNSLKPSLTSYQILGPGGDLLLTGLTTWSAFFASLSVLRFVVLEPEKLELNSLSQQAIVGLPLAGTMFWSLRNTLNMARETFLTPESVVPAPASAPAQVSAATPVATPPHIATPPPPPTATQQPHEPNPTQSI
jgi:hypothetical protein